MTILHELATVLVVALVLGAGLPGVFAVAVRCGESKNMVAKVGSWLLYAVCLAVIVAGVLLITNNTIAHYTGVDIYGIAGKGGH